MPSRPAAAKDKVLSTLSSLRQHQHQGKRSPHKPLLVLLALSRLSTEGTSAIEWSVAEQTLADLIRDYGPPTSGAMLVPAIAAVPLTTLGVLDAGTAMTVEHVAMFSLMLVVMLRRREEYSAHAHQ